MKQILQNLKSGETFLADLPAPAVGPGQVIVRVKASAVSPGTERMVLDFARKNLFAKARSRPDLLRQAWNKVRRDGVLSVWETTQNRLEAPLPLGYSCSGIVMEVGSGCEEFSVGDRISCAGSGYANHAEFITVPKNLCVKLPPDGRPAFEEAALATLGAVALQGFRLGNAQLGENVAVIGLGILGQLAGQIARAAGCRVFGVDLNEDRTHLARATGFHCAATRDRAEAAALAETNGRGFDAVLITADSASSDPVELAGIIARDRATIVAVGAVGTNIPRNLYYHKELTFKVSRSYGPGRYDPSYEEGCLDYPYAHVRWTEQRNLAEIVRLMAEGALQLQPLISHRFPIESAQEAYALVSGKSSEPSLGIILTYPENANPKRSVPTTKSSLQPSDHRGVGVLGAGNFASAVMLPVLTRSGLILHGLASRSGLRAHTAAKRFGFAYASSLDDQVLQDKNITAVVILTRHNRHAEQVCAALGAGKHVLVEKPLCMTAEELLKIEEAHLKAPNLCLTVGFNRRFAPFTLRIKEIFRNIPTPKSILIRVNAGALPSTHWLLDSAIGGGRLIGEGCHFIDWANFIAGVAPASAECQPVGARPGEQDWALRLNYPNGTVANILYTSDGHPGAGKERYEVHAAGTTAILEDFRRLIVYGPGKTSSWHNWFKSNKGHSAQWEAFSKATATAGSPPVPWEEVSTTMKTCFAAQNSLHLGRSVKL